MLRRELSIIAAVVTSVLTLAGCSGGDGSESAATTVQADSTAVKCDGDRGGAMTVQLVDFDEDAMQLTAVNADGALLTLDVTGDTSFLRAFPSEYPPDPIFPACRGLAVAYDQHLAAGLTYALVRRVAQLAEHSCSASVVVGPDSTLASFQPVPSADVTQPAP
jgi:hypothetical protein